MILAPEHLKLPQTAPNAAGPSRRFHGHSTKKGFGHKGDNKRGKRNDPLKSGKLAN